MGRLPKCENRARRAGALALERLMEILSDRETGNADTFKAIALLCDHFLPGESAPSGVTGDMEIRLREDE